jgi:hypothetical protein
LRVKRIVAPSAIARLMSVKELVWRGSTTSELPRPVIVASGATMPAALAFVVKGYWPDAPHASAAPFTGWSAARNSTASGALASTARTCIWNGRVHPAAS